MGTVEKTLAPSMVKCTKIGLFQVEFFKITVNLIENQPTHTTFCLVSTGVHIGIICNIAYMKYWTIEAVPCKFRYYYKNLGVVFGKISMHIAHISVHGPCLYSNCRTIVLLLCARLDSQSIPKRIIVFVWWEKERVNIQPKPNIVHIICSVLLQLGHYVCFELQLRLRT